MRTGRLGIVIFTSAALAGCFSSSPRDEEPPDEGGLAVDDGGPAVVDDGGAAAEPSACEWTLVHEACPPEARLWREGGGNRGFEPPSDLPLEGTWQGIEARSAPGEHDLVLDIGGTVQRVRVWADPAPLESLLEPGDDVRLAANGGYLLTLHRVSEDALLLAIVRIDRPDDVPSVSSEIEGLGATVGTTSPCDDTVDIYLDCPPMAVRGYALEVGGEVVGLSGTRDVATSTGTFRITHLTTYGPSDGSTPSPAPSCSPCAVPTGTASQFDVVRVE